MTFGIFTPYCAAYITDAKMENLPGVYTALSGPFISFTPGPRSLQVQASLDSDGGVYNLVYIAKDALFAPFASISF